MSSASSGATRNIARIGIAVGALAALTLLPALPGAPGAARADVVDGLSMRADPDFDDADLTPEQRLWYDRLVEALDRSAGSIEGYANGRDLYRLARTVGNYNASLLMGVRATGNMAFLDRMAELSEMFRATLADEWLDGTTDGYLNWIYLQEEGTVNYGKDIIALEEAMMHGNVALIAYAFHVNRDLDPSYAEMADFWVYYLEEHFLAKWYERAGDPIEAWETGDGFYKRLAHPRANQLRIAVYLWKITGDPFYLERANVIADHLLSHVELNPSFPGAYRWKHQVSGGELGWQKVSYSRTVARVVVEMHLEQFGWYADVTEMERYATTYADAVFAPFAPAYTSMALRVDGSEVDDAEVFDIAALSRWDPSGVLADVAEVLNPGSTYGVFNASSMLMAVSPPRPEDPGDPIDILPPATITSLVVTGADSTSVSLAWTAPGDDGHTGTAEAYEVRWSLDDDVSSGYTIAPNPPPPAEAGTPEAYVLGGLPPETTLYIAIRTRDDAGLWSQLSNVVDATTDSLIVVDDPPDPDNVPPAMVTDLEVVDVGSRSVVLAWTATGDDMFEGRAHHYDLRFAIGSLDAGSFDDATPVFGLDDPRDPGTIELVTVNGLAPDTRYYFAVVVEDEAGNRSPVSNDAEGRTLAGEAAPMPPPAAPSAHYESGTIMVSWAASSDPNVVGYHVYRQAEGEGEERLTTSPALIEEYLDGTVDDGMAYFYRVTSVDGALNELPHSASTWIRAVAAVPNALFIDRIYPNPVGAEAVFRFSIPEVGPGHPDGMYVTIDLYDVAGRSVARVVEGHFQPGVREVTWRPGERGRAFAPGIYMSVLRGGGQRVMERIAILRP